MKVFLIENNGLVRRHDNEISWRFLADSAISNAGKPFFIPEGEDFVELSVGFALRICRLGKTVAKKFSHRYYDSLAPVIKLVLPALKKELIEKNLSLDPAFSFDRSLFYGDFIPKEDYVPSLELSLLLNGEKVSTFSLSGMTWDFDDVISLISKNNTLKMGDYIIPALSESIPVKEGDIVQLISYEKELLKLKIR